MIDTLITSLQTFYGMDWLCMFFGFIGTYLIGSQKSYGFIIGCIGCFFGLGAALISQQYGFVVLNSSLAVLNLRGYILWKTRKDRPEEFSRNGEASCASYEAKKEKLQTINAAG